MNVFLLRVILTILIGSFWYEAKRIFELEKRENGASIFLYCYTVLLILVFCFVWFLM